MPREGREVSESGVDVVLHIVNTVTVQDTRLLLTLLLPKYVRILGPLPPVRLLMVVVSDSAPLIITEIFKYEIKRQEMTRGTSASPELSVESLETTQGSFC